MIPTPKPLPPLTPVTIPDPRREGPTGPTPGSPATSAAAMPISAVERSRSDPNFLDITNQQPGIHYRWVRSRKDEAHSGVSKARLKGYSLVKRTEGGVQTIATPDDRADGVIAIGDLVLMECPESLAGSRAAAKLKRTQEVMASATAETEQMAREKGVKLISDADHKKQQLVEN